MSKDKVYGIVIGVLFFVVFLVYALFVFLPYLQQALDPNFKMSDSKLTAFLLMLPVFGGVALFSFIFMWIGYTMATTPPPEPIDLDSLDLDDDEEETTS